MTPSTAGVTTSDAAAEQVKQEVKVSASRRDNVGIPPNSTVTSIAVHTHAMLSPSSRSVMPVDSRSKHLPPPPTPCDRRSRRSPPPPARPGIETPAVRPASHTAPARPLARPADPELAAAAAAAATHAELESLPTGFEMTTACPICQTPIPFDAASSDAFSRHVDECISRVTSEGPVTSSLRSTAAVSTADRTCPVCNMPCPPDKYSQMDFERHVNDHFADEFTPLQ